MGRSGMFASLDLSCGGDNVLNQDTQPTVPIIFLPGIMGSRLDFTKSHKKWDPDDSLALAAHWILHKKSRRWQARAMGHGAGAKVKTTRSKSFVDRELKNKGLAEKNWRNRGWSGISWRSYGPFFVKLAKAGFGGFDTPLFAIGYDWTQSNRSSGKYVHKKIKKIFKALNKGVTNERKKAKDFILLTHSMGGLVGRSMLRYDESEKGGALSKKLLGVIHGVQPVNGTPSAYQICFTGNPRSNLYQWLFAKIMGSTGKDVATMMAYQRGFTELLPNQLYERCHRRFYDHFGEVMKDFLAARPEDEDLLEYKEFTRNMPATTASLTSYFEEPWLTYAVTGRQAGTGRSMTSRGRSSTGEKVYRQYMAEDSPPGLSALVPQAERTRLMKRLQQAGDFHEWLNNVSYRVFDQYRHENTWAFFGLGLESIVRCRVSRNERGYEVDSAVGHETYPGGDGTGSAASESALFDLVDETVFLRDAKQCKALKIDGTERQFGFSDVGHETAYNDARVHAVVRSVITHILRNRSTDE